MPVSKPYSSPAEQAYVTQGKPVSPPAKQTYAPESKPVYSPPPKTSSSGGEQTSVTEYKPVTLTAKPSSPAGKQTDGHKSSEFSSPAKLMSVPENKPAPQPVNPASSPGTPSSAAGKQPPSAPENKPYSSSGSQEGSDIRWLYDPDQVFKLAKMRKKPVMMDFYTDGNGQCKLLDSDVYSSKEIVDLSEQFIAVKVNAEKYPKEVSRYNVQGYPTVIFFDSGGSEKTRMNGFYDKNEFYKIMSQAAK